MKLHVKLNQIDNIDEFVNKAQTIVLGSEFSLRSNYILSLEEIKNLVLKYPQQTFLVEINKIIHEFELPKIEAFINELNKISNVGIIYQDLGVLNYVLESNFNFNLVYDPQTYLTSSKQINFYKDFKVTSQILSRELTIQEVKKILENVNCNNDVWMFGFGYTQMLHSKRNLVRNYENFEIETFNNKLTLNYDNLSLYDEEREVSYPIFIKNEETFIMSAYALSVIEELLKLVKYGLENLYLDFTLFSSDQELAIFNIYFNTVLQLENKTLTKDNLLEAKENINTLTNHKTNLGLLYKKTMYKI